MKSTSRLAAPAALLALACVLSGGCEPRAAAPHAEQKTAGEKSAAQTMLEGVTGKAAVDQGLSAKKQLQAIDQQRRKDMETLSP